MTRHAQRPRRHAAFAPDLGDIGHQRRLWHGRPVRALRSGRQPAQSVGRAVSDRRPRQSACTLFLGIRNVCIDRNATLRFHAGHDRNKNILVSSTNHMLGAYNARLRDHVTANHYMDTLAFHAISSRDMIQKFGYRECPRK
jgi:hypothetical protein